MIQPTLSLFLTVILRNASGYFLGCCWHVEAFEPVNCCRCRRTTVPSLGTWLDARSRCWKSRLLSASNPQDRVRWSRATWDPDWCIAVL